MKATLNILTTSILVFFISGMAFSLESSTTYATDFELSDKSKIIAVNDTFNFISGCGTYGFGGNVITNDLIPEGLAAEIQYVICTEKQTLSFGKDGNFAYITSVGYTGSITIRYHLSDANDAFNYSEATVIINIKSDFDCDGVFDLVDIDDDNDGIPDTVEGYGLVDSDSDGVPDSYDIDSDNDGITDNIEWQAELNYIAPSGIDTNNNGWDDVYEENSEKSKFVVTDTDGDSIPDYRDSDSDNDGITDFVEANDQNNDGLADLTISKKDFDNDGLDDVFDIVKYWIEDCNSIGSNVLPPDHNNNGISDYREKSLSSEEQDKKDVLTYDRSLITFPNPNNGLFTFHIQNFSIEQESYIKIFNLNGELKVNIRPSQSNVNVDLTHLESGIYIVKMITPDLSCSKKLILQNN